MIMPENYFMLGIVALQVVAAALSFSIYSYNRVSFNWLALTWGMVFVALGTSLTLVASTGLMPNLAPELVFAGNYIFPLLSSILFAVGLWGMLRNFEQFDMVEKRTLQKLDSFEVKVKGKRGKRKK